MILNPITTERYLAIWFLTLGKKFVVEAYNFITVFLGSGTKVGKETFTNYASQN